MGLSTEQVDALAHSLGLLPEDKHIEIDASGDVSAIENAKNAVEEINNAGNVQLQVSAEGDISVLDTADEKLKELEEIKNSKFWKMFKKLFKFRKNI